ncbi:hypothetical protein PUNSTDRAFT_57631 [Punctularia strigosozonata HHB-11173 SS5]|uniref:uncharacterized protein n=1 Tax=Punctularia strigosozonata (strain HHB-11173) TaxID=741275 RepID=UPI000441815F|nr:uncharacterized protein PUNSTDRAFT_57631 [Punctularia strigosozonata HHB-11173 SS5]EIN13705.1 hypothetical protein PUNSTDRAFT_57631 [Punctularia strigosozonata HHB-11173 SS5]
MAAFSLASAAPLRNLFRFSLFTPSFAAPAVLGIPSLPSPSLRWSLPDIWSLLELLPPIVLAVPKKKVSHSRKSMRSANKGLKDKHNLVHCPACGSPKLAHHLCQQCYSELNRNWKAKNKASESHSDVPAVST